MTEEESTYSKKHVWQRGQALYSKASFMLENVQRIKYRQMIGIDYDLYFKKRVNSQKDEIHTVYATEAPIDSEAKEVKSLIQEDVCEC